MASGNPFDRSGTGSTSGSTSGSMGGQRGGRNRRPTRNRRPNRNNNRGGGGGGGGGTPEDVLTPNGFDLNTMLGSGKPGLSTRPGAGYGGDENPLDTGLGSEVFNDPELRRESAWGLLNQAGIAQNPSYGGAQAQFIDDQVTALIDQYEGIGLTQNPDLTYENFWYGVPGEELLGGAPPPGVPGEGPGMGPKPGNPGYVGGQPVAGRRPVAGTRPGNPGYVGTLPDLGFAPAPTPGTDQWRQDTYNPAITEYMRRAWQAASPSARRYDSSRWTGRGSTVAF